MDTEDKIDLKYVDVVKTTDKNIIEDKYYNYEELMRIISESNINITTTNKVKDDITHFIDCNMDEMMDFVNETKGQCEPLGFMNEYNAAHLIDLLKYGINIEYNIEDSSSSDDEEDVEDYFTS